MKEKKNKIEWGRIQKITVDDRTNVYEIHQKKKCKYVKEAKWKKKKWKEIEIKLELLSKYELKINILWSKTKKEEGR